MASSWMKTSNASACSGSGSRSSPRRRASRTACSRRSMSASAAPPIQHAIRQLAMGASLSELESRAAFGAVMQGEATPAQVAALLVGLRVKGETPDEVAGAADALRGAMVRLRSVDPGDLVDTCGTGGGAIGTFNISTAAALLAAGVDVRIAKHGNRSFTSQCAVSYTHLRA